MTKTDPILRCVDDSGAEGEYYALDRAKWREVRKVQKEDKGKPFVIPPSGNIRLPSFTIGKQVRIFAEVSDDDPIEESTD
jgi:hypothetical protein